MSVVLVKAPGLCEVCLNKSHLCSLETAYNHEEVIVAVECNDLCTACMKDDGTFVDFVDPTTALAKKVRKASPYVRRERWVQRWRRIHWWFIHKWERFDRWNHYGRKAFPPRENMVRCCTCGYNFLVEDLDPVSGDGEMCGPCFDKYTTPPSQADLEKLFPRRRNQ